MRILALSDTADKALWDYLDRRLLEGVELVLACGDLPAEYLSFLTCFTDAPILYVPGNHDEDYARRPPEGCVNVDGRVYVHQGVRILGLGGSMRYRPGPNLYSEREMRRRVRRARWQLLRHGGIDILMTHAPARGVGDREDLPHQGFAAFNALMDRYAPRYMLHGHVHPEYGPGFSRVLRYGETEVINVYKRYLIDF